MGIVFMRLTVAQKAEMDRAAERAALPTSSWLRMVGLEAARKSVPATKPQKPIKDYSARVVKLVKQGRAYVHPKAEWFEPHGPGFEFDGHIYRTAEEWLTVFPEHTLTD